MDLNTVRELVQVLEGSTLSVLEITEGTEKIRLEKGTCAPRLMEAPAPAPVFSAPGPPPGLRYRVPVPGRKIRRCQCSSLGHEGGSG